MSPTTESPKIIVVLGATGNQGGGVVKALLTSSSSWIIRAGTRDPTAPRAQNLLAEYEQERELDETNHSGRLELVTADPYKPDTLQKAFAGAHGVFALTSERHPHKSIDNESDMRHEVEAGRSIVRAAKECGVRHFVFSSLPDMKKATDGRFPKLYHMDNKYAVEQIAREELPGRVTCLIPGFFFTNLQWQQYSRRQDDGVVRFCYPLPATRSAQWTDPSYDMGSFAAKVFDLGVEKTQGKTYLAMSPPISAQAMAETFTRVTGQSAVHSPTSFEEFGDLTTPLVGKAFKEDAMQMMEWAAESPEDKVAYGAWDRGDDASFADLGLKGSTFEEWLKRSGWTGP